MDRAAIDDTAIVASNSVSGLAAVLSLSNGIFSRVPPHPGVPHDPKFSQIGVWEDKLVSHDGTVFSGCVAGSPVSFVLASHDARDAIVGGIRKAFVKHLREKDDEDDGGATLAKTISDFESSELKVYYIWLAGTLEEYREFHLMRRLFEEVAEVAQQKGYNVLALKTHEGRFKLMYEWCARTDWLMHDLGDGWALFFKFL